MQVVTKNRIVFIEDVEEKPYRIDRMLTQMIQARTLVDAAGIVIGRNVPEASCEEEETAGLRRQKGRMVKPIPRRVTRDFEPVMSEVFAERLGGLGIPILLDLPFGHIKDYATLPEGIMAEMSTDTGDLVITESAVR
jgi:muramoyltetrapeptide carboxypeptidase